MIKSHPPWWWKGLFLAQLNDPKHLLITPYGDTLYKNFHDYESMHSCTLYRMFPIFKVVSNVSHFNVLLITGCKVIMFINYKFWGESWTWSICLKAKHLTTRPNIPSQESTCCQDLSDRSWYTKQQAQMKHTTLLTTISDRHFRIISFPRVYRLLLNLNPRKAAGPYGVPCCLLQAVAKELVPALTLLFNSSLETGQVPQQYKYTGPTHLKEGRQEPCS